MTENLASLAPTARAVPEKLSPETAPEPRGCGEGRHYYVRDGAVWSCVLCPQTAPARTGGDA